mmetsp:Transcript_12013/g.30305  ORF Transcript_12013/g.30305 Transcript_12013/m.30305 type:complete len:264 (-) Transcript_12013:67-858(-)
MSQDTVQNPLFALVSQDILDMDFYENITHILVHRRAKAIRRLIELVENEFLRELNSFYLHYVLPLCLRVFQESLDFKSGIDPVESAVLVVVEFIAGELKWSQRRRNFNAFLRAIKSPESSEAEQKSKSSYYCHGREPFRGTDGRFASSRSLQAKGPETVGLLGKSFHFTTIMGNIMHTLKKQIPRLAGSHRKMERMRILLQYSSRCLLKNTSIVSKNEQVDFLHGLLTIDRTLWPSQVPQNIILMCRLPDYALTCLFDLASRL